MIARRFEKILLLAASWSLVFGPASGLADAPSPAGSKPAPAETTEKSTVRPLAPGPMDGRIAYVTAMMLKEFHYTHQEFDDPVSSRFFERYLEALDPQHMHFLQSDIAEFEQYRTNLNRMTLNASQKSADTRPAFEIFNRFLERLGQRVACADDMLKHHHFTFTSEERVTINRKELPYPKDLDEAKKLWSERLQLEYLQEKLGRITPKKKEKSAAKLEEPGSVKKELKPKSDAEEIVDKLTRRYRLNLRTFKDWNSDDILQVYLSALAHIYDPHSDYLGKAQFDQFSMQMNLALFGIGAELTSDDGYCTIRRLLPGGPAAKSGKIKEKDRIVEVAQGSQAPVDVVEMALNKAVQLIRGPKGTEVRLTIIPADDPSERRVITLTRDEIKLEDSAAKAKVIDMPNGKGGQIRLGVIDLPSFYASISLDDSRHQPGRGENSPTPRSTTTDVAILLKKLEEEHVQGIILDLRGNGGGLLDEAVKLTGLFIKQGPVVQVRADRNLEIKEDQDPSVLYDGPLVVLTSRFSASASEIVAGALQDYGRGLVVGDVSTHGKGSAQRLFGLRQAVGPSPLIAGEGGSGGTTSSDPGALKITNAKFYRASGASTELKGVLPDIVLPSVLNYSKDVGESALENPLPYDTIQPVRYEKLNRVERYLGQLLKRSTDRTATNQDFVYIREDIDLYRKLQADKTVSLNEKQRLNEKDESDARQKVRDKERLARSESPEKVYEITLKLAQEPGLPPAVVKTNSLARTSKSDALPGASTNSAAALASNSRKTEHNDDAESDEPTPPAIDAPLEETEHILVDYLSLLGKKDVMTADQPMPATTRQ